MNTPGEVMVDMDKETRSVIMTPGLIQAVPDLQTAFSRTDATYLQDPYEYLKSMHESVFMLNKEGQDVPCSLIYNSDTSKSDRIMVMFAPFSDGEPETPPEIMLGYINRDKAGLVAREKAKPNTWNQTTKAAVAHDLLHELDEGMPVLTIYSPVPPKAYTKDELRTIRMGDISPVGKTAEMAVEQAQRILHGAGSETQIELINTHGASLGDNAIGAASVIAQKQEKLVESVTAQELILMNGSLVDLADRYSIRMMTGEESDTEVSTATPRIDEPLLRQDIDRHGSEPSTYWRVAKAMAKISYLKALIEPQWLIDQVVYLANQRVPVTVANAVNSAISRETASHLPVDHPDLHYIDIKAIKGQKVGHLADEHVALVGTVMALGVKKANGNDSVSS